jgi:arabinan endo-1,5-alpha-L-arabinosidase
MTKKINRVFMKYFLLIAILLLASLSHAQHNPILNQNFPDPTVILAPDGKYYAYATNTKPDDKWINIQVTTSTDLFNWKYIGDALPQKPTWASNTQNYWAPHVLYDASLKQYVLFYCARNNDTTYGMCIGVAFSSSPTGPFVDKGTPLMKGKDFRVLDPMAMIDPKTKKKIMYWGSDFAPISVTELTDDWKDIAPNTKTVAVIPINNERDYTKLVEGAWVDYHDGKYYLYYSGDNCCGDNANYAVMVARADNAFGPFTRLGETRADGSSVILAKDDTWFAPGHNSIVHDKNGNIFIIYHAIWKNEADASRAQKQNKYVRRVMCIEPVVYKNGWPVVEKKY